MGTFDTILAEAGNQFGLSSTKTTTLLSGLLSLITETPGGLGAFLDRFRKAGLGDSVSSWLGGSTPRPISSNTLESAIGSGPIGQIAANAGITTSTAASALAFMLPNLIQRLTPGGVIPTHLPSDALAYASSATSAVAAGTRQAAYATGRAVQKAGVPAFVWPLLAVLVIGLLGYWLWNSRQSANNTAFNIEEQVRMAGQKAAAALGALKPGFTAQDLVSAVNLNVINFPTGSAQIPADQYDFLNKVAIAIKAAPPNTVLEIGGYTDNTGDAAANLALSQQRADAVRTYLVQQGVGPEVLVAKGYGDAMPVGPNDTEEGKFHNRRITFTVH
jgi:outer membrane protein OmpA-like peptidoglycan-associated protein